MGTTALGGFVTAQHVSAAVAAGDLTANAVLASVDIPGDATVLDVIVAVTDMDTGASGLVDVGDTDDDNRFVAALSIQAAGNIAAAASGNLLEDKTYTYSATGEQTIEVTVNTAPATAVAGTVDLTVVYFRNS